MKLPKGITGFLKSSDEELPEIGEKWLKEQIYLCTSAKYVVHEITLPTTSTNFYKVTFVNSVTGKLILILVNDTYPFFAGVTEDSSWMQNNFIEVLDDLKNCLEPKLTYLSTELLNTEFVNDNLSDLGKEELAQIKYWKCKTFGEIIFNEFD
ncbi:hypothetical protein [Neptunitalea lumnitzerae]|uniref:Uncharacterized protein n=1 Tax=Neptunitalea lumnitzerae TaxID=2965509 RepID=A0ABQ5MIB9_9FLAO|nr:hypothetical protein [Neptunitalea sp. Y10]GLB49148.1 hypothetical protein Y10_15160 [Neptunitalea sp. Y10]